MTDPLQTPAQTLADAEQRAVDARDRLSGTVAQLQARLDPKLLMQEAREAGTAAALAGVDGARRNPAVVAGVIGATLLVVARHRIASLFRRKSKRVPATPIDHSLRQRIEP